MDNTGAYLTTYRDDYRNPYSRSIIKRPPKPPEWTRNNDDTLYRPNCLDSFNGDFSFPKPIDFGCGEDANHMEKFHGLNDKKQDLISALHESGCPLTDDIIKSLNHSNKDYPVLHCKALKADNNCCDCGSEKSTAMINDHGYRDPFPFRLYSVNSAPNYRSPIEDVCSGPNFFNRKNTLGISEYMDTISKSGRSTMLAVQQFREPTPSSRRRLNGQCIQTC